MSPLAPMSAFLGTSLWPRWLQTLPSWLVVAPMMSDHLSVSLWPRYGNGFCFAYLRPRLVSQLLHHLCEFLMSKFCVFKICGRRRAGCSDESHGRSLCPPRSNSATATGCLHVPVLSSCIPCYTCCRAMCTA